MGRRLFLAILFLFATTGTPIRAETLRFAPLPMERRETQVKQFRPLVLFLESKTGASIAFDFSDDYGEILEKVKTGKVDLAYLGPLPYVQLRETCPNVEPLVHFNESSGEPTYSCAIISFADAGLNLGQARALRFALTQPLSTCGYLSTNALLMSAGSELAGNRYRYLEKHDEVALAVVRGEFDAGGIKTAIARKYFHLGLAILAETPPLPAFALVANRATMSEKTMETIRDSLVKLNPSGADRQMLATWGENVRYGAVEAFDADYDVVRKLKGNMVIPTGNKD